MKALSRLRLLLAILPCVIARFRTLPALAAILTGWSPVATAQSAVVPASKTLHTLVTQEDSRDAPYSAFPAVLDLGTEILISFKRGEAHAADPGAALGLLRLDPATREITSPSTLARTDGQIMQMGEWVRFANGDVANYIDAQQAAVPRRIGLRAVRSGDGGATFGSIERVGDIEGVEYGYAFEAVTRAETTWMLVMAFGNLKGGKAIHQASSQPGSVDVVRSDDNGRSWRFVRSITGELGGAAINESSLAAYGDGFIIAARGYEKSQWLLLTDGDFKLMRKVDLADAHPFIRSVIGRPRVFERDGAWYLLARNFIGPGSTAAAGDINGPMRLSLFRFDPDTLGLVRHVLLDNAEGEDVTDGYYAAPYWRERDGRTFFNIITYKGIGGRNPDIIRLEFDWEEVR